MHLLDGEDPFEDSNADMINIDGVPNIITEEELHDNEFIKRNYMYLNMIKDLTKT